MSGNAGKVLGDVWPCLGGCWVKSGHAVRVLGHRPAMLRWVWGLAWAMYTMLR